MIEDDRLAARGIEVFLSNCPPYPGGRGRGVLIAAGGEYLVGAYVVIGTLRSLGCALPVEIWYQGPTELTWVAEVILERYPAVSLHDIGRAGGPRDQGGWQLKAEALAQSAFAEVILLDADSQPLMDPEVLFECDEYRMLGALFWQGCDSLLQPEHGAWPRFGLEPRAAPGIDSGQMVINRKEGWPAVALAAFLNKNSNVYWRGLWGDKDTFMLSWLRTYRRFWIDEQPPTIIGGSTYHATPWGERCFRHRFNEKWSMKQACPDWDTSCPTELIRDLQSLLAVRFAGGWLASPGLAGGKGGPGDDFQTRG